MIAAENAMGVARMEKLSLIHKTAAQARAAGRDDSRRFMTLYRAYLRGASEAASQCAECERDNSFKMLVAAMVFALLSWTVTLYFVFK